MLCIIITSMQVVDSKTPSNWRMLVHTIFFYMSKTGWGVWIVSCRHCFLLDTPPVIIQAKRLQCAQSFFMFHDELDRQ